MNNLVKYIAGIFCLIGSVASLIAIAFSEMNFKDTVFATYFGLMVLIAGISFFVILKNDDNEETNPEKEKIKK